MKDRIAGEPARSVAERAIPLQVAEKPPRQAHIAAINLANPNVRGSITVRKPTEETLVLFFVCDFCNTILYFVVFCARFFISNCITA